MHKIKENMIMRLWVLEMSLHMKLFWSNAECKLYIMDNT